MPLDPPIAEFLATLPVGDPPPVTAASVARARADFRTRTVDRRDDSVLVAMESVTDTELAGVAVRVYRPAAGGPVPTVVFFHGGGWVIGDLDTHESSCRLLARDTGAVVVSVDYRRAPEHPFPAAVEDALAVLRHVGGHRADFGGGQLGVAGDSAGGNLAAVGAQALRADGIALAAQLLVYPSVDLAGTYPSRTENARGYLLTTAEMRWFMDAYLPAGASPRDPRVSPLLGELAGLPPAVVVTAEFDPLRDEGNAYAAALAAAGVPVTSREFPGLIHGFYGMETVSPAAADATAWTHARFADVLHRS
jgi:acetyl esterase